MIGGRLQKRDRHVSRGLQGLEPSARMVAVDAIQRMTRPLCSREIEDGLRATGLSRTDRKRLKHALARYTIVALIEE